MHSLQSDTWGGGMQCRKQPRRQRQQHCSHGDRKERTRLDQSRLEQTPPPLPPPLFRLKCCCLSHSPREEQQASALSLKLATLTNSGRKKNWGNTSAHSHISMSVKEQLRVLSRGPEKGKPELIHFVIVIQPLPTATDTMQLYSTGATQTSYAEPPETAVDRI